MNTLDELDRIGAVEAWCRVKEIHPRASIVLVYDLEAALWNLDWRELSPEIKETLRNEIQETYGQ